MLKSKDLDELARPVDIVCKTRVKHLQNPGLGITEPGSSKNPTVIRAQKVPSYFHIIISGIVLENQPNRLEAHLLTENAIGINDTG